MLASWVFLLLTVLAFRSFWSVRDCLCDPPVLHVQVFCLADFQEVWLRSCPQTQVLPKHFCYPPSPNLYHWHLYPFLKEMYKVYRAYCGFTKATLMLDCIVLTLGMPYFLINFFTWTGCYSCIAEFIVIIVVMALVVITFWVGLRAVRSPLFCHSSNSLFNSFFLFFLLLSSSSFRFAPRV